MTSERFKTVAPQSWLAEELVWGVEVVPEEPSREPSGGRHGGQSSLVRWTRAVCLGLGRGTALRVGEQQFSNGGDQADSDQAQHRKRLNSAWVTTEARSKQALQHNEISLMKCIKYIRGAVRLEINLVGRGGVLSHGRGDRDVSEEDTLRVEEE